MAGHRAIRAALGRSGIKSAKREGDGATPAGEFRPVRLWWRADRLARPRTLLPVRRIGPDDAWCEDPADRRYNRPIHLGPGAKGDRLRRDDHLYDLIVEIDHNTRPRIAGRGAPRTATQFARHFEQRDLVPGRNGFHRGCQAAPATADHGEAATLHHGTRAAGVGTRCRVLTVSRRRAAPRRLSARAAGGIGTRCRVLTISAPAIACARRSRVS
jgi:hypothetical protein